MKLNRLIRALAFVATVSLFSSCTMKYSFSGASISPESKTFSVAYFQNLAPLVVPSLSNTFTEALKDRFLNQTRLDYIRSNGDLSFEGQIVGYSIDPVAITGNDKASQNRLTITVRVKFTNKQNPELSFTDYKEFKQFKDFPSNVSVVSVQNELIKDVTNQLIDAIFNASVANW
ncbi:LptE family protein [uncultured Acetobacteroides sp.]|uniref:LptE family protein n=1 Tax=uncultured Acetobacteroides sp. TaxID=1760811 RepID=UPI0029F47538|nr:LptE family protein [uncultured Acetobacteroides sp.]